MASGTSFVHFGPDHLVALVLAAAVAVAAALGPRRSPSLVLGRRGRWLLAGVLLLELAGWNGLFALRGRFSPATDLPLHLCDINQLLLAVYLIRPRARLFDVVYHWVPVSSFLALVFPDLAAGFPSLVYFSLFSSHGLSLAVWCYLTFGRGIWPGPGSAGFALLAVVALAVVVEPVNWLVDGNYLYLSELPAVPIPLLGSLPPAPYYWPVGAAVLYLAFRSLCYLAPADVGSSNPLR